MGFWYRLFFGYSPIEKMAMSEHYKETGECLHCDGEGWVRVGRIGIEPCPYCDGVMGERLKSGGK